MKKYNRKSSMKRDSQRRRHCGGIRSKIVLTLGLFSAFLLGIWFSDKFGGIIAASEEVKVKDSIQVKKKVKSDSSLDKTPKQNLTTKSMKKDWKLILVNATSPIPENYEVSLTTLDNGESIDERCFPELQKMMDDCRKEGLSPLICSSYRSKEKQQLLFEDKKRRLLKEGVDKKEVDYIAAQTVARPGTSEHEVGLAVDIVDENHQLLDDSQEQTAVTRWLMINCWKYGFILRYPKGRTDITGVIYEPWHYRYVGKDAAKEIYEEDIDLEEYLDRM